MVGFCSPAHPGWLAGACCIPAGLSGTFCWTSERAKWHQPPSGSNVKFETKLADSIGILCIWCSLIWWKRMEYRNKARKWKPRLNLLYTLLQYIVSEAPPNAQAVLACRILFYCHPKRLNTQTEHSGPPPKCTGIYDFSLCDRKRCGKLESFKSKWLIILIPKSIF